MHERIHEHLQQLSADERLPLTVLQDARSLAAQGSHDLALEKYLWFHQHSLKHNEALAGVRLSFALSEWIELGVNYPPARHALLAVRDDACAAFASGKGSFQLFMDVAAINRGLHDDARTVQLFKDMHQVDPQLATQCYGVAEQALVDHGEYALCLSYVGDLAQRLEGIRELYQVTLEIAEKYGVPGSPDAGLKQFADWKLADETGRLIAILEGTGDVQGADRVREFVQAHGKR